MRTPTIIAALALMASLAPRIAAASTFAEASADQQSPVDPRPANNPEQKPAVAGQTDVPENKSPVAFEVVTVVEGLQNPWGMTWLPSGKMLITERPGRLRVLSTDGKLSVPVTGLPSGNTTTSFSTARRTVSARSQVVFSEAPDRTSRNSSPP